MEIDTNPYRSFSTSINPIEFEKFCMDTISAYAKVENLKDFTIGHNQKISAPDGTYQIDVLAEYTALGCKHRVVFECKKYSRNIERSLVAELYAKTQSIGAQKGVLISTSGFQKDAVKFAKVHGIGLWQICDTYIRHFSASAGNQIPTYMRVKIEMEKHLPKYFMMEWDCTMDYPYNEIYPTADMIKEAREKAFAQISAD